MQRQKCSTWKSELNLIKVRPLLINLLGGPLNQSTENEEPKEIEKLRLEMVEELRKVREDLKQSSM